MKDTERSAWAVKPLGDVCDLLDRLRKPITKRDRISGPYPYYGATGILDHVDGFLFNEPLVLIGEDGAKWEAGANSAFSIRGKTWVNNHAHVIRPHRGSVLDEWLVYYLNGADLMPFISGMTVPKLNQGRLREIPVPLPPLDEQKRIVAVLDAAFEVLTRARAHAEANLENARELFESYSNDVFTQTAKTPATVSLGEVIDVLSGFAFKSGGYIDDETGIRLVRGDNIVQGRFRWKNVKRWSADQYDDYSRFHIQADDVLLAMDRTWVSEGIKFTRVREADTPSLLVQRVARLRCCKRIEADFLTHLIGSKFFEKYVLSIQTGLGVPHISGQQIKDFEFVLPELSIQREASEELDKLLAFTNSLRLDYCSKLTDLDDLRQSLLQKAFAGELT